MPDKNLHQSETKLVAGHLREKNNLFYIVLNLKVIDTDGNSVRKPKWIPTGLAVKGNKKRAEKMLMDARIEYSTKVETVTPEPLPDVTGNTSGVQQLKSDMLFADFLDYWLDVVKSEVRATTFASYHNNCTKVIGPYFRDLGVSLCDLKSEDIELFYLVQRKRPLKNRKTEDGSQGFVKPSTIIHYHALIHKALKYARKKGKIELNPMDTVDRPKYDDYVGDHYTVDEVNAMLDLAKGSLLEVALIFASFYGLRRSEIIGLKWDAVDFTNNTFIIKRTVNYVYDYGSKKLVEEEKAKNKSSRRTMPLVESVRVRLEEIRANQEYCRKLCGNSYNKKYIGYLFVDKMGNLMNPDYITGCFRRFLARHQLRRIRFHDLRHTCASLLYANGAQLKDISEYLGHSTIDITSRIYVHLDFKNKIKTTSKLMDSGIKL